MAQNNRTNSPRAPPSVSFTLSTLTVTFVTDHIDESKTTQRAGVHVATVKEEAQNSRQPAPSTSHQSRANDGANDVHSPVSKNKCNCRYLWSCSLHGLNQFMQARCRCSKSLWGLLILACLGISAYTTRMVFTDYIDNETATLVTIRQTERLQFPSIVLCPKNPDALNLTRVKTEIAKYVNESMDEKTINRLIAYAIAGAGFDNAKAALGKMKDEDYTKLNRLLQQWRGERTYPQFFNDLLVKNGYDCEEFLDECWYGGERLRCCEIFRSYYVMLRGRCFRLKNFYQMDPDRFGRLYVSARRLPSRLVEKTGLQPEIVTYIASPKADAYYYPRYYIKQNSWNYLRFQLREVKLLPWNADCFPGGDDHGKTACYLAKWLWTRVIEPYNCTLFYLQHRIRGYEICEPEIIVRNSAAVYNVEMNGTKCLPACDRKDLKFAFFSNTGAKMGTPNGRTPAFRFETSFINMEYERYEEIQTTSVPGFVSQIGGQTNLFMGFTVLTLVQLITSIATIAVKRMCCREGSNNAQDPNQGGLRGLAQKYMSRSEAVQS